MDDQITTRLKADDLRELLAFLMLAQTDLPTTPAAFRASIELARALNHHDRQAQAKREETPFIEGRAGFVGVGDD